MGQLPVVADCEGCGVCCLHMGYPAFVRATDEHPDEPHWQNLPRELKQELEAYVASYQQPQQGQLDGPCYWFDQRSRQCKHYAHRPRVCRDFEVGSRDCLGWRQSLLKNP